MTKHRLDPTPLDTEDAAMMQAFEAAFDAGALVSHLTPERQSELRAAARRTMNPPKRQISTRLAERDLLRLKARALEQGMPYQSLLASIVHRYVEGALVEKK